MRNTFPPKPGDSDIGTGAEAGATGVVSPVADKLQDTVHCRSARGLGDTRQEGTGDLPRKVSRQVRRKLYDAGQSDQA
jgi:hypothetical protein